MAPPILVKLLRKIELPQEEEADRWINEDIRPVPPQRQTWGPIQYVELWFCVNLNMSSYQVGSSLLATGLNFWQAIIVILIGNLLATGFAVLNSVAGASSHLGFPVISRSVWGMYGAYFPILNRILTSVVWYGVQAVIGGRMIYICLRSIWIDLDDRIPNTLPTDIGITTAQFLGYIIFNVLCCIFIWFRPQQLRPYFHFASVLVFLTLFILLGWAVGTSDSWGDVLSEKTSVSSSSELGWNMVAGMMSIIGNIASGILNQSDYTRFAKKPSHVTWSQAGSFMVSGSTVSIVGVLVTAATQKRYGDGTALWDPTTLFAQIQDRHGSRGRAAAFFLGVVFIFSQLSINVVGNVLAGGLDVASVFPKYINLRRGAYVLAALSVLPNPWQQLSSSTTFLAVLSAYAVFLGPMIGLLCIHFWVIQKRTFIISDLYIGNPKSVYWYKMGVNWQTVVAWVLAVVPSMPGFVASINTDVHLHKSASHVFSISFLLGFTLAAFFAYTFNLIWPVAPDVDRLIQHDDWPSPSENSDMNDKGVNTVTTDRPADEGV
ncbi:nucleobase:cation symporter-1, NCS1 family [Geosmithia morbida]|uniref:Nucleobase:cation symporter-1, NCS1 family n=1 Tax=Geosmithia morbida TaxID=1094350 RepID=A0A9P4YYJ7_9HYPO|nr:nucleobase:cation symporter-1, NCS1 family [Geosmithia morbida]KAF4125453.1 nucleobase:cation symporter-1, NCS1 family [Geosmithia morbida]